MEIPPTYSDLGKSARELFLKGFNFGLFKLKTSSKTLNGIEFVTNSSSNESGQFLGSVETLWNWKELGLTFKEKWNTDNSLGAEVTIEDRFINGLKLSFDTFFSPASGKKNGFIRTEYATKHFHTNCDFDANFAGPIIASSSVIGFNNWLAGYQIKFDTSNSRLLQNNVAIGYVKEDLNLNLAINDGAEFLASLFYKVSPKLSLASQINCIRSPFCSVFGIAAKYDLHKETTLRGFINSNQNLGLSVQQKISKSISLNISSLVVFNNFDQEQHKMGLGLEFEN